MPSAIGVYLWKKNDTVLYIGKSINIRVRVISHLERAENDEKERSIVSQSTSIEYVLCNSDFQALLIESELIQKYKPKYNVIWRDDKSYLYIKIPIKTSFPRVQLVRKEHDPSSLYFGPFSSTKDARYLIRTVRTIIPFCMQKETIHHSCFYSKIQMCNPCPAEYRNIEVSSEIKEVKKKYRHNILLLRSLLSGKTNNIQKELRKEIKKASLLRNYETAIQLRNKLQKLEFILHNSSFERMEYANQNLHTEALIDLNRLLKSTFNSTKPIQRIECYDVSNLNQKQATASMVVATNGLIDKTQYRRFKLRLSGSADILLLEETIRRRLQNNWTKPDLIVVDGGAPQVRIVQKMLLSRRDNTLLCIGLAKNPDRLVFYINNSIRTVRPSQYQKGFNLLRQLRDEAHRFAKKYHLFIRTKDLFS